MKFPMKMPQAVTRAMSKLWLRTKKSSPEICVVSGIVCGGAALVMVGVRTWKKKDDLQKDISLVKDRMDTIKGAKENNNQELVKSERKELVKQGGTLAKDLVKTYWVPALLGVGSAGLIWGGRTMLRRELSAVTSAYALLMESYKQYRQRVIDDVGIEKDQEYMHGIKMVDAVDEKTGEVTRRAIVDKSKSISPYSVWWCEGEFDDETGEWIWRNGMWRDNALMNESTLRCVQNAANDYLKANGFVFLNQVREMLGLPPTREGQIVGWTLCGGDGYIDFGVFPSKQHPLEKIVPVNRLFLDKKTCNALLDFNVDGPILGALDAIYGKKCADKLADTYKV